MTRVWSLLAFGLALPAAVPAATADVTFNGYRLTAEATVDPSGAALEEPAAPGGGWIVGLDGPVTAQRKAALAAAGWRPLGYLPHNGLLVRPPAGSTAALANPPAGVAFARPLVPAMKIDRAVEQPASPPTMDLIVHFLPDVPLERGRKAVTALGLETIAQGDRPGRARVAVRIAAGERNARALELARLDDVHYVERARRVELQLNAAVPVVQSGAHDAGRPLLDAGLDGAGQVVAVCDTGIDADICWFRDPEGILPATNDTTGTLVNAGHRKVLAADFWYAAEDPDNVFHWDTQDHGTSVAACVGAARIDAPTGAAVYNGVAPGCAIVMQDAGYAVDNCADLPGLGCPVIDLVPLFQQAYDQGARVHNNSWGDRENFVPYNIYSAGSQDVDAFTWDRKDFLLVFACGNWGTQGDDTVLSPGTAKSCLAVGATNNGAGADSMASFSSRGWADDGRIKPDLCAPGSGIAKADNDGNITTSNCGVSTGAGTSFASPLVAGAAALVRQYFAEGYYPGGTPAPANGFDPSAALVKAVLINSAVDVAGAADRPARTQGWGRVALVETLDLGQGDRRLFVDDHRPGFADASAPAVEYAVEVVSSGEPLKITLVWSDYPATLGANPQLVNDLDLVVHHGNDRWYGNVWSGGQSVTGGTADRLNSVEQVYLPAPARGMYEVRVDPAGIPEGPQDYALALTGAVVVNQVAGVPGFFLY